MAAINVTDKDFNNDKKTKHTLYMRDWRKNKQTIEAKEKIRENQKIYKKNTAHTYYKCQICDCDVRRGQKWNHERTQLHQKNTQITKSSNNSN